MAEIVFPCRCGMILKVYGEDQAGHEIACPSCGASVTVPEPGRAAPPSAGAGSGPFERGHWFGLVYLGGVAVVTIALVKFFLLPALAPPVAVARGEPLPSPSPAVRDRPGPDDGDPEPATRKLRRPPADTTADRPSAAPAAPKAPGARKKARRRPPSPFSMPPPGDPKGSTLPRGFDGMEGFGASPPPRGRGTGGLGPRGVMPGTPGFGPGGMRGTGRGIFGPKDEFGAPEEPPDAPGDGPDGAEGGRPEADDTPTPPTAPPGAGEGGGPARARRATKDTGKLGRDAVRPKSPARSEFQHIENLHARTALERALDNTRDVKETWTAENFLRQAEKVAKNDPAVAAEVKKIRDKIARIRREAP